VVTLRGSGMTLPDDMMHPPLKSQLQPPDPCAGTPGSIACVDIREPGLPPFRLFYPLRAAPLPHRTVDWLRDLDLFLEAFQYHVCPWQCCYGCGCVCCAIGCLRCCCPPRHWLPASVRHVEPDEDPPESRGEDGHAPLIIFSHGLLGTGDENNWPLACLASKGYVVCIIHHTDGSSPVVRPTDGKAPLFFQGFPEITGGPTKTGPQLAVREQEMQRVKSFMCDASEVSYPPVRAAQKLINRNAVIAAGFSYGGTTSLVTAANHPEEYICCVAVDPWLEQSVIGLPEICPKLRTSGVSIQTLLLVSEEFQQNEETSYQELYKHSHANSTYDIMPGTKHLNFNDLIFWWSPSMLQCFTALGTRDPLEGYEYAVNAIDEFCSSIHVSKSQYGGSYGTMLSFANESSHQKKL